MPCNDYDIDIAMQNIGEADMTNTTQFVTHMEGGIRELSVLQDRFINVDELWTETLLYLLMSCISS